MSKRPRRKKRSKSCTKVRVGDRVLLLNWRYPEGVLLVERISRWRLYGTLRRFKYSIFGAGRQKCCTQSSSEVNMPPPFSAKRPKKHPHVMAISSY